MDHISAVVTERNSTECHDFRNLNLNDLETAFYVIGKVN